MLGRAYLGWDFMYNIIWTRPLLMQATSTYLPGKIKNLTSKRDLLFVLLAIIIIRIYNEARGPINCYNNIIVRTRAHIHL